MGGRRDLSHDKAQLALKAATRDLMAAAGGTDGSAATLSQSGGRVRQQRMSDCQLANTPDFLRIDEVARLEDVAIRTDSWPQLTRVLADRHGFDLVHRPTALPSGLDFCAALAAAVKEFGDIQAKILKALPDGVTAEEIRDGNIRGEIADAQRCLAQIDALCAQVEGSGQ